MKVLPLATMWVVESSSFAREVIVTVSSFPSRMGAKKHKVTAADMQVATQNPSPDHRSAHSLTVNAPLGRGHLWTLKSTSARAQNWEAPVSMHLGYTVHNQLHHL